jgi:hypothetical protein
MKSDAKNNKFTVVTELLWFVNASRGDVMISIIHMEYLVEFPSCPDKFMMCILRQLALYQNGPRHCRIWKP